MSFISPDNYELGLITKDITDKKTYYANNDGNVIKIYKDAPAIASDAQANSLYDLVTDAITGYEMGTDPTPEGAVPFYVITEDIGEQYKISENPQLYVLPSLNIEKFDNKVEVEKQRLAKIESDRLAEVEAERLRLEKIEADRLAEVEAERLRLEKIEADRLAAEEEKQRLAKIESDRLAEEEKQRLAKIESDRLAAAASTASTATTSKPQRRGFPNFGSSCWALSIIHLFYDTTDFREHILNYNIQNIPEIFTMDIKHYIGLKSGKMFTQYHIDKLKSKNYWNFYIFSN